MTWVAVVVLAVVIVAALFAACLISTPRRPASDATYTANSYLAAGAVVAAALLAVLAAVLAAGIH